MRGAPVWLVVGLAVFGLHPSVTAQEVTPPPIVRARLLTEAPIMVSQPAELAVEVLVPTFLRGSPGFPDELPIPDAVVLLRSGSSLNLNERIDGQSWAGLRRTYTVFPTRSGLIEVPSISLQVPYQRPEEGFSAPPVEAVSEPISFAASLPAAAAGEAHFFATRELTLTERWEPAPDAARVGSALTRTVSLKVVDTPAMFLPALEFPVAEGATAYQSQPTVSDSGGERGSARFGERVERVTYSFEQEGELVLPPIEVTWWNLEAGRLERSVLPAVDLEVSSNPELEAEQLARLEEEADAEAGEGPGGGPLGWIALLTVPIVAALAWRLRSPLTKWLETRRAARRAHEDSEVAYFKRLRRAIRGDSDKGVVRAWMQWLDRRESSVTEGAATLSDFLAEVGDPGLRRQAEALLDRVYRAESGQEAGGAASRRELEKALVRSGERAAARTAGSEREQFSLPALNPATSASKPSPT